MLCVLRTWTIAIQLRLEFLQLIYDFLASNKAVTPYVNMFSIVRFLLVKKCGRMAKALRCSLAAGVRRGGSNPVLHLKSLWTWMSSTHRSLIVKSNWNYASKTLVSLVFFLMKHVFIHITQVWAHYFKLFNPVQSTQDEKATFIKENELKLSYFYSFFLREY